VALLLVQLSPQTAQVLGIVRLLVALTSLALADTLIMIQPLTMLLLPALDIPSRNVLAGRWDSRGGFWAGVRRTRSEAVYGKISLVNLAPVDIWERMALGLTMMNEK
jgi:hypothetical protein